MTCDTHTTRVSRRVGSSPIARLPHHTYTEVRRRKLLQERLRLPFADFRLQVDLQLPGRGRRDLKRLLNELGVPAFVRPRLPLLFDGDELVAVANLAQSPRLGQGEVRLHWAPPIGDQGLSW